MFSVLSSIEEVDFDLPGDSFVLSENYPFLVNDLLKFIDKVKSETHRVSLGLLEIIEDYANMNDLDIRLVGEAISEDDEFTAYVRKDCEVRGILKSDYVTTEDW